MTKAHRGVPMRGLQCAWVYALAITFIGTAGAGSANSDCVQVRDGVCVQVRPRTVFD